MPPHDDLSPPLEPANLETLTTAGWQAFHRRDWDEATRCWANLRAAFPDAVVGYTAAITALREAGQFDHATALAQEAIHRFEDHPHPHFEAVWLLAAQDRPVDALAGWDALQERFPAEWVPYFGAARALRALGRHPEAEARLEGGLARFPAEATLLADHAAAAANRRDWTEASKRWAAMRVFSPDHPAAYSGGAEAARALGRLEEAETLLRHAMDRFPRDAAPFIEYARAAHSARDWPAAIERWASVRDRFPGHLAGYIDAAQALREAARFDEADAVLLAAREAFPQESAPWTERAWLAHVRGDFAEAARRWEDARSRFPDLISTYTDALHPLRELKRHQAAEAILIQAVVRFPDAFAPAEGLATLALHRRDWPQAERLFAALRARFPNQVGGYNGGVLALREQRRMDEAEALARAAVERFPQDSGLRIDQAWLATIARDWAEAIGRWEAVRQVRPDFLDAYVQTARALRELWRHEEAEALLAETMMRFPAEPEPAAQHASLALHLNRFEEAEARFARLRGMFPVIADGWLGGEAALRSQFEFSRAEGLLEEGIARFPDNAQLALEHAQLPVAPHFAHQKDWPEALRRFDRLHAAFPGFELGFITGVRLLNDAGKPGEAEALAKSATERLPDSYALAIQYAEAAEARTDWAAAEVRYRQARDRFPELAGGEVGLARALAGNERFAEAEAMLRETIRRFQNEPAPFGEYAELATRQENWGEAVTRWADAASRFPHEARFAHRSYEARLRITDLDPVAALAMMQLAPAPMPDASSTDQTVRDLAMQFESLGGRGLGCEFGIFQRDCGAEPLGLLRWADMPYESLLVTLRNRFEGVGTEEYTELFTTAVSGGRPEYCTRDHRDMMFMRTFVYEDEVPAEKMKVSALNRLRFLTRKLIDDLESGSKIFVFRLSDRNLTTIEIDALHDAMRSYGNNMLLYVRYDEDAHPNGTVELVRPGLMIGYMDRFKISPSNQLSAAPPTSSWLAVCRNAFSLWRRE